MQKLFQSEVLLVCLVYKCIGVIYLQRLPTYFQWILNIREDNPLRKEYEARVIERLRKLKYWLICLISALGVF